jgi:hypothetical protein
MTCGSPSQEVVDVGREGPRAVIDQSIGHYVQVGSVLIDNGNVLAHAVEISSCCLLLRWSKNRTSSTI